MSTRFDATRLGKGINLNEWLMLVSTGQGATSLPGWAKFLSDDPLERLRDSDLGHIRLPFDPLPLIPPLGNRTLSDWGALPDRGYLARITASILLAVAADIAVVLVPRLDDAARHDELLGDPDTLAPLYAAFWGALARHLAGRRIPPEMLAFELLNEPRFVQTTNGAGWADPTVANDIWLPVQAG